jgi:hypothetical protein
MEHGNHASQFLCSRAAGVEVSLPNIVAGLKFSWPIYKSGFHVLIASAVEEGGIWAFAQVNRAARLVCTLPVVIPCLVFKS